MSEKEFELYLSLLGRFLRLKPGQRREISDELRDHLEARLEELSQTGLSREEAVQAALEEFGDAADLARHFTHIAQRRRRRFIMRCTLGTVAGLTAAILVTSAFWPGEQAGPAPKNAMAQHDAAEAKAAPPPDVLSTFVTPPRDDRYRNVVEKLKMRHSVNFQDTPIREVVEYVGEVAQIPILFDTKSLNDIGFDIDNELVTHNLNDVPVATCLELILGTYELSYRIWDGFVIVETAYASQAHMEVHVYNCRDLLDGVASVQESAVAASQHGGSGGYGGGFFQIGGGPGISPDAASKPGSAPKPAPESTSQAKVVELSPSQALIRVLMNSVEGPWDERDGEGGTITAFDGLLVVRNNQRAQRDVQTVLEMLRAADRLHPRPSAKRPQAGARLGAPAPTPIDDQHRATDHEHVHDHDADHDHLHEQKQDSRADHAHDHGAREAKPGLKRDAPLSDDSGSR